MPEWSIGTGSKTVVLVTVPRVRIPLFPQSLLKLSAGFLFFDGEMSIMTLRNGEQADDLRHCGSDILQCHSFVDGIAQRHWMVLN